SLVFSLFMFKFTSAAGLDWMGASVAGIAEEIGKLAAVLLLARSRRYPYILNGLLFGAAVGAGFAAYESAGYALTILVSSIIHATLANAEKIVAALQAVNGTQVNLAQVLGELYTVFAANVDGGMLANIAVRGLLAPFGHVAWTAIAAGGFWMVKGDRKFTASMLADIRFVGCLLCAMVLHIVWNSPWEPQFFTPIDKCLILGVLAWIVILSIARRGLKQLAEEKARYATEPAVEEGVKEIIRIQTVYVEKLVEPAPVERKAEPKTTLSKGYDHLGIAAQVEASKTEEENRERPDFGGRSWYRGYGHGGEQEGGDGPGGTPASKRRWEKYYQRGDDDHDRK
ncbi:MAG: PrsW family intramembrane metalloprotease, partial [Victivallales bacterium]|nr:PrsW family intramembrane metalloprotease [Victivallales bacterium]